MIFLSHTYTFRKLVHLGHGALTCSRHPRRGCASRRTCSNCCPIFQGITGYKSYHQVPSERYYIHVLHWSQQLRHSCHNTSTKAFKSSNKLLVFPPLWVSAGILLDITPITLSYTLTTFCCPRFRTHFDEFIFQNYKKTVGWTVTVNISFISVSKVQVLHQQFFEALVLEILTTFHQQSPQCFTKMHGWGEKNGWKVQYPAVTKEPWHHLNHTINGNNTTCEFTALDAELLV